MNFNGYCIGKSFKGMPGQGCACSSSGFNSGGSGLHSPAGTAIDSHSSDDYEQETFTWWRYLKIGIVVVVFLAAAVRDVFMHSKNILIRNH